MRKRTRAERCHYEDECRKALLVKRARHCGLTANGRSQANRGFSRVRNVNCCFARCAAKAYNHCPLGMENSYGCRYKGSCSSSRKISC